MNNITPLFHGNLVDTNRIIYTPSEFAKQSLMHIQEIGMLQAQKPHTSSRENLASYLFIIVNSGSGSLTYEGNSYVLSEGDCVFIDCMSAYSHSTSDNLWSISWIHFNGPTAPIIYQKYLERGGLPVFHPESISKYQESFNIIYQSASSDSYVRDMIINGHISSLLTFLMEDSWNPDLSKENAKKNSVMIIRDFLDEHFTEKITLDQLAERFYINKFYLTRIFKEQYGISINNYILSLRITLAKQQLRFSNKTAEEIGLECGIGELYYFSRVFKKVEGISISQYRKQWNGKN